MAGSDDIMGASEEVQFLSGMERDPMCDQTVDVVAKKLWTLDGMIERVLGKAREAMETRNPDRGPDPDAPDEDEERVLIPVRWLDRLSRPRYNNGGGDDESSIKRWHLVLAVLGVVIPLMGAAWSLSIQMSAQFAAQSAMISNIRDHQREQDERATRVEQQIQQLTRDRR